MATAMNYSDGEKKLEELSREYVLDFVHSSGTILKVVYKFFNRVAQDAEDLINDIYTIVWSLPNEKLFLLYLEKQLLNYVAMIIIYQVQGENSAFNKLYETGLLKINIDDLEL